ncbi:Sulfotransferase domain [Trinorchestia longiramus]|nr:Sulfotransferase domain [Trinorchestia longiramus]
MDYLNLDNRVQKACTTTSLDQNSTFCYDPHLHKRMCQSSPVIVQKLVRLESSFIPELLKNKDLNLKIVVLMRDPRAMMTSRKTVDFCNHSTFCSNASLTCAEMERTFNQVAEHQSAYYDRLYFLRYEDLVSNLKKATEDLFAFLELPITFSVSQFLQSHTELHSVESIELSKNPFSTYKNSANVLFYWRKDKFYNAMQLVQLKCDKILKKLKYRVFDDEVSFSDIHIPNIL